MSNNDCISRLALYEKTAEWEAQALHMVELHLHDDDKEEWRKWYTVLNERSAFKYDVADAPAVPQEMSAREFAEARDRLCDSMNECTDCPIYKACLTNSLTKILPMVEAWAREHSEERSEE